MTIEEEADEVARKLKRGMPFRKAVANPKKRRRIGSILGRRSAEERKRKRTQKLFSPVSPDGIATTAPVKAVPKSEFLFPMEREFYQM